MPRIPAPILVIAAGMLLLAFGLAMARDTEPPVDPTAKSSVMLAQAQQGGMPAMGAVPAVGGTQAGWLPVAQSNGPVVQYAPPQQVAGGVPGGSYAPGSKQVHFLSFAPTIKAGTPRPHGDRGTCTNCHDIIPQKPATNQVALPPPAVDSVTNASTLGGWSKPQPGQPQYGYGGQVAANAGTANAAATRPPTGTGKLPDILPFQEAHWQGIEAISLSPGLGRLLGIPQRSRGVVIDEVTMPADVQGFGAGDLITAVGGRATPDLESFVDAADRVRDESNVVIDVVRKGEPKKIVLSARRLGTASGETAPMIPAGARAPHGYQGPCTNCHRIGTGGSLAVDLGDVLSKSAPPIYWGQPRPHQDRGPCTACHTIR